MPSRLCSLSVHFCVLAILLPWATAQYGAPGFSNSGSHGGSQPSSSSSAVAGGTSNYTQTPSFKKSTRVLITHAVLGTLAWAFFAPLGAILLRLNIPGVSLLKFHAGTQLFVYAMTVATSGLGIWLAIGASNYGSVWTDSHVIIGLIIFSVANIQPWIGYVHHIVFKKRLLKLKEGIETKKPGRTTITIFHIWIGRILILLGVINGGLGLRLAATTPFQTASTTHKAEIAYGILAGLMFLLFAGVSILFEHRRAARIRNRKTMQRASAPTYGQADIAVPTAIPFSPISSEDSLDFEEKGSEI